MHIKCPESQLMYQSANEHGIIPKFSMVLLFGLICLCKEIRREKAVYVCCFAHGGDTSLSEPRALLREAPVRKRLTPKLVPIRPKKYRSMFVPCHDTMPSFMIFRHVLDLQELKNQVSQSFRPSHNAHMFEFYSHFLHGT